MKLFGDLGRSIGSGGAMIPEIRVGDPALIAPMIPELRVGDAALEAR
jgi:hypothetical protein